MSRNREEILQDFVERVVVASIDNDDDALEDIYFEFHLYYQNSKHKGEIRDSLNKIKNFSNDPAMDFFTELIL